MKSSSTSGAKIYQDIFYESDKTSSFHFSTHRDIDSILVQGTYNHAYHSDSIKWKGNNILYCLIIAKAIPTFLLFYEFHVVVGLILQ